MTNVQQPEMRRSGNNPTVQDSKGPGTAGHPPKQGTSQGDRGRPTPRGQASPYGPRGETADDESDAGG